MATLLRVKLAAMSVAVFPLARLQVPTRRTDPPPWAPAAAA